MKKIELLNKLSSGKYVLSVMQYGFRDIIRIVEVDNKDQLQNSFLDSMRLHNNIILNSSEKITQRLFDCLDLTKLSKFNARKNSSTIYYYQSK